MSKRHWMNPSNCFSMKKYLLLNRQKYWCCLVNTSLPSGKPTRRIKFLTSAYVSGTLELEQWWLVEWMIWVAAGAIGLFIYLLNRSEYGGEKEWGVSKEKICLVGCSVVSKEESHTSWSQKGWPVMWALEMMVMVGFIVCSWKPLETLPGVVHLNVWSLWLPCMNDL